MRPRRFPAVLALFTLITGTTLADVIPGRWEKVDRLDEGTRLLITLLSGDRLDGQFVSSSPEELVVTSGKGQDQRLVKSQVSQVTTTKKDSNWDGAAIGLAAGVGVGVAIPALTYRDDSEAQAIVAAITIPVGLVSGLVAGYAADRLHKGQEVLYRAAVR